MYYKWGEYTEKMEGIVWGTDEWRKWEEKDGVGGTVEQEFREMSKDEVKEVLKRMKIRKAVGLDDILVEVWICIGERAVEFFTKLFYMILDKEKMPEDLQKSVL